MVRVAGNTLGEDVRGSLRYALEHLGDSLKLVVVLGHSGCGAVTAAVDVFLDPAGYLSLASKHAVRSVVDRLHVVVHASARRLEAALGQDIAGHPRYREALIEMAIVTNAALAAHSLQREIGVDAGAVQVAYGVYVLAERSVWAPRGGSDQVDGLASPPDDADAFIAFSDAVLRSRRIGELFAESSPGCNDSHHELTSAAHERKASNENQISAPRGSRWRRISQVLETSSRSDSRPTRRHDPRASRARATPSNDRPEVYHDNRGVTVNRPLAITAAALCAFAAFSPTDSAAQTADSWKWQASIYLYMPTIDGTTTFPQTGSGSDVALDAGTIVDNLKMTFMGSLEAHKGRWGMFTDVVYMDLGNTQVRDPGHHDRRRGPARRGKRANVSYDLKGWAWTLAGLWRVSSDPASTLDVVAGARLFDMKQTLGWEVTGNIGIDSAFRAVRAIPRRRSPTGTRSSA